MRNYGYIILNDFLVVQLYFQQILIFYFQKNYGYLSIGVEWVFRGLKLGFAGIFGWEFPGELLQKVVRGWLILG